VPVGLVPAALDDAAAAPGSRPRPPREHGAGEGECPQGAAELHLTTDSVLLVARVTPYLADGTRGSPWSPWRRCPRGSGSSLWGGSPGGTGVQLRLVVTGSAGRRVGRGRLAMGVSPVAREVRRRWVGVALVAERLLVVVAPQAFLFVDECILAVLLQEVRGVLRGRTGPGGRSRNRWARPCRCGTWRR